MGGGTYSSSRRASNIAANVTYAAYGADTSPCAVFKERSINNAMSPYGVTVRESRDSVEHPNSLAIILAMDETGSMGAVPHYLVKTGLPNLMTAIIEKGVNDPQVLFVGIGDHECDKSPLQVGQFESSDELLDLWLTRLYLEGNGGGNDGESYLLAWYLAAYHTSIDCLEKRGKKGYLFTIGDEPTLKFVSAATLRGLMGDGQYGDMAAVDLFTKASEKYNVYHLHILKDTHNGKRQDVVDGWRQMLGDKLVLVDKKEDVPVTIAGIVIKGEGRVHDKEEIIL